MYLWQYAVTLAQHDYTDKLLYLIRVLSAITGRVRKPYCCGQPRFSAFLLQIRGKKESIHLKKQKTQNSKQVMSQRYSYSQ